MSSVHHNATAHGGRPHRFDRRDRAHRPRPPWHEAFDRGRLVATAVLGGYALWTAATPDVFRFLDWVDLAFHEAGHLVLTPFGQVLHFLGGTLGQLFWPVACGVHFWRRGQRFSSAVMLLWLGQNFFNIARYQKDAVLTELPLVGGGMHDWNWLLTRFHALKYAQVLGNLTYAVGVAAVFAGIYGMVRFARRDQA